MSGRTENSDDELKRLERDLKIEEIRQLRTSRKVQWVTPAAIAVLLPLFGAFVIWAFDEVKTYSKAYRALAEVDALRVEKSELIAQKDSLNIEIFTLLSLKSHYATEAGRLGKIVDERQTLIDQIYLRAKFAAQESVYALGHVAATGQPVERKTILEIRNWVSDLDPLRAKEIGHLIERYEILESMSSATEETLSDFLRSLNTISPSVMALNLHWNPTGMIAPNRSIMTELGAVEPRYYDVELGRLLTSEEVRGLKIEE